MSLSFLELSEFFEKLEATTKRNEMVEILKGLFNKTTPIEAKMVAYLLQGRISPSFTGVEIGMGEKFVEGAISNISGKRREDIESLYAKKGDLGIVAFEVMKGRKGKQSSLFEKPRTIATVFAAFKKIAESAGAGAQQKKIDILQSLLLDASPLEAKYLVRIPLNTMRLGVGDQTLMDAASVTAAGDKSLRPTIERAYNLCSDLGTVLETFFQPDGLKRIESFSITPLNPVRPALAERLSSAAEIIEKLGECAVEHKYDGFRCQIHKRGSVVEIFSRNQERMTHMFPDLVKAVKACIKPKDAILEGEALAFNEATGQFLPFQDTIQRKRKHDIERAAEELPMKLFLFDILYADGMDYTPQPYLSRRKKLERTVSRDCDSIRLSSQIITSDAKELNAFFNEAVENGLEGIIAKDLKSPYEAGARKFSWVKLKKSYQAALSDTIDAVILGYFKGKGKRTGFGFGGLLVGVYDGESDEFKSIAKLGTGFTETAMETLREALDRIKVQKRPAGVDSRIEPDVWVAPKYVVTVQADEITRSPLHTAGAETGEGFALRFPRLVGEGIRDDKGPSDATTVSEIKELFGMQKQAKGDSA